MVDVLLGLVIIVVKAFDIQSLHSNILKFGYSKSKEIHWRDTRDALFLLPFPT